MLDLPPPTPPPQAAPAPPPEAPQPPPDIAIEPQDLASDPPPMLESADDIQTQERQLTGRNAFTAQEIAKQVWQVQEWLIMGYRPNHIRKLCASEWGLATRVAEYRIAAARQQIVQDVNVLDRQQKVGQMVEQLEKVLEMSLQTRQGSNAIGAIRLQADLLQLLARQN